MSMEEAGGVGLVLFGVMIIVFHRVLAERSWSAAKRVFGAEPAVGLPMHLLLGGIMMVILGIVTLVTR